MKNYLTVLKGTTRRNRRHTVEQTEENALGYRNPRMSQKPDLLLHVRLSKPKNEPKARLAATCAAIETQEWAKSQTCCYMCGYRNPRMSQKPDLLLHVRLSKPKNEPKARLAATCAGSVWKEEIDSVTTIIFLVVLEAWLVWFAISNFPALINKNPRDHA